MAGRNIARANEGIVISTTAGPEQIVVRTVRTAAERR
jgi:hypothetical protein